MRHNNIRDFDARSDIRARGFWRKAQNAFFDVRVTNANSASQQRMALSKVLEKHEQEKKRNYNERIMNIEHGSFTPLVYSINGGVGPETQAFHKEVAQKIADKTGDKYDKIVAWIRCKLSFVILRACLTCLRGSRPHSSSADGHVIDDFELACDDARIPF